MFDIDGTLIQSYDYDSDCFVSAVKDVTGIRIDSNWSRYLHVTDVGILHEIIDSQGLSNRRLIINQVKAAFIQKLEQRINEKPIQQVPGASVFLNLLKSMDNIVVSLATGGWYESASLKLKSAGINISNIPVASSNDHYIRTEIMKIAASRVAGNNDWPCTYFGDGYWDKKACEQLGITFVLVGNNLHHQPNILNFESTSEVMACIGLEQRHYG